MKRIDKSAVFLMAVGVFAIFEAKNMGTGNFSEPGPGLFPLLSGIILLTFSLISLLISSLKKIPKAPRVMEQRNVLNVLCVLGTVLLFRFFLPVLGYIFTALITLVLLIKIVGGQRWSHTIVWSMIFTGLSYLLFGKWLMVQFPRGIFLF
jgi:putative tricarboxylic transport membrane protein